MSYTNEDFERDHRRDENPGRGGLGKSLVAAAPAEVRGLADATFPEIVAQMKSETAWPEEMCAENILMWQENPQWAEQLFGGAGRTSHGSASGFNGSQASVGMEKFARLLVESANPKLAVRLLFYALNSPALDDVLNHSCPADFAKSCDCTRANATKYLSEIQSSLGLPPRKGQRDAAARKTFSDKQKSIWAKAGKKKSPQKNAKNAK